MRGRARATVLVRSVLVACALAGGCGGAGERPRHVVLFVVDTLRADRLGCYGHPLPTSPQLDALAAQGTVYLDHRAQGTWTRPSMISLMSGLYVTGPEETLPDGAPTLAERVRAGGRLTAAFVGNPLLSEARGFARGFEHFAPRGEGRGAGKADAMVSRAAAWLDGAADEARARGLFLWVHVMDPHTPLEPDEAARAATAGEDPALPALVERWRADLDDPARVPDAPGERPFDAAVAHIAEQRALYDAEVRGMDAALGRLVDALRAHGLWEDTLLVFASDHGEELWEHRKTPPRLRLLLRSAPPLGGLADRYETGHGMSLADEAWRTPLVLVGPGVPAGVRETRLSANLDIVPTVLDALGLPQPDALPGRSLHGGRAPAHEHVFGYSHHRVAVLDARGMKYTDARAWRATLEPALLDPEHDGPAEALHDLGADPGERTDLLPGRPGDAASWRALVDDWRAAHDRARETALPDGELEALVELGYVEPR